MASAIAESRTLEAQNEAESPEQPSNSSNLQQTNYMAEPLGREVQQNEVGSLGYGSLSCTAISGFANQLVSHTPVAVLF